MALGQLRQSKKSGKHMRMLRISKRILHEEYWENVPEVLGLQDAGVEGERGTVATARENAAMEMKGKAMS